jgi:hypothetical protein
MMMNSAPRSWYNKSDEHLWPTLENVLVVALSLVLVDPGRAMLWSVRMGADGEGILTRTQVVRAGTIV